jgi:hypothetical protein
MIGQMFKEDPMIKVMTQSLTYQGQEMSRVVVIDYHGKECHLGPKTLSEPIWMPKEDFVAADMVLDYAEDMKNGVFREFPDCPKPRPIIPENQYFKPETEYILERFMGLKGFVYVDPSLGLQTEMANYPMVQLEDDTAGLLYMKKYLRAAQKDEEERESYFFLPYHDVKDKKKYEKIWYVAMQFNPFHPMAIHFIRSFQWEGSRITGTYEYRNKILNFDFDINDQRYRIHSHIWLQVMRGYGISGAIEPYDLVGNFDFNEV